MAVSTRVLVIASLLLVLSLHLLHVEGDQQQSALSKTIDCGSACATRCRLSKRPRLCKRSCGSCCFRCQCVPPGTSGNTDACPCYATMTTHGNRLKCP